MPRVADIYQRPPGIDAVPNQTIESIDYNTNVADVEFDLNFPRPIVAGGTGANSAVQARDNLDAEVAMQTVTDYDTHVWETGSFKSSPGAISSPDGAGAATNFYLGTVQVFDSNNIVVEARNLSTGNMYMRKKVSTWGVWTADSGAGAFVLKAGDTMTGDLYIQKSSPTFNLMMTGSGQTARFMSYNGTNARWIFELGDSAPEAGGNVGSNVRFVSFADNGTVLSTPLWIERSTGNVSFGSHVYATLNIQTEGWLIGNRGRIISQSAGAGDQPSIGFHASGRGAAMGIFLDTLNRLAFGVVDAGAVPVSNVMRLENNGNLWVNGDINSGARLIAAGGIISSSSSVVSQVGRFMATNVNANPCFAVWNTSQPNAFGMWEDTSNRLTLGLCDGGGNPLAGQWMMSSGGSTSQSGSATATQYFSSGGIGLTVQGVSGSNPLVQYAIDCNPSWQQMLIQAVHQVGSSVYWQFQVSVLYQLKFDGAAGKPGGGQWYDNSDARIKNVLGDYQSGLDAIKQLRPVRYTFKGNDTLAPPAHVADPNKDEVPENLRGVEPTVPYRNSPHWGVAANAAKTKTPGDAELYGIPPGGKEFIGLIAQETEGPMPELVTKRKGFIDGVEVDDVRDLDPSALVFALINAVKELAAKVETLEAKLFAAGGSP